MFSNYINAYFPLQVDLYCILSVLNSAKCCALMFFFLRRNGGAAEGWGVGERDNLYIYIQFLKKWLGIGGRNQGFLISNLGIAYKSRQKISLKNQLETGQDVTSATVHVQGTKSARVHLNILKVDWK